MKASAFLLALALMAGSPFAHAQVAQGTSFTFQGVLQQSGVPLNGTPNVEFRLFDSTLAPTGPILTKPNWPVSNGQLTVELDFGGGVFNGQARYLQITVNGTVLSPLLPISSTPYAIAAQTTIPNSVNGLSVVDGNLSSADIDASMQRRVSGTCTGGNAIRAIDVAGAVTCEPVGSGAGGGDITAVNTLGGSGLVGGAASGDANLSIAPSGVTSAMIADGTVSVADLGTNSVGFDEILPNAIGSSQIINGAITNTDVNTGFVQLRVAGTCTAGNAIRVIDAAGAVTCEPVSGGGAGDITDVITALGSGLAGGSASGAVSLSIPAGAITSAMVADNSVGAADVLDGTIGSADINSAQVQRRLASGCSTGSSIRVVNADGSVVCETDSTGADWGQSGNIATNPVDNFIGTLDGAAFRIEGSAVGVSTSAPLAKLHVRAGGVTVPNGTPYSGTIINAERASGDAMISIIGGAGQQRGLIFGESGNTLDAGIFYDYTNAGQMDFRTGGNVIRAKLGVSDPDGANDLAANTNLQLLSTAGPVAYLYAGGTPGAEEFHIGFQGSAPRIEIFPTTTSVVGNFSTTGQAYKPGGGSWAVLSDVRLKHHVEPLDSAMQRLLALRGVSFEYRPSDSPLRPAGKHNGFIAQEVQKVFPEWVGEGRDGYLFVAPTGFEALTVEALRDLKASSDVAIESLREENAQMRGELASVRGELDALRAELRALARRK